MVRHSHCLVQCLASMLHRGPKTQGAPPLPPFDSVCNTMQHLHHPTVTHVRKPKRKKRGRDGKFSNSFRTTTAALLSPESSHLRLGPSEQKKNNPKSFSPASPGETLHTDLGCPRLDLRYYCAGHTPPPTSATRMSCIFE